MPRGLRRLSSQLFTDLAGCGKTVFGCEKISIRFFYMIGMLGVIGSLVERFVPWMRYIPCSTGRASSESSHRQMCPLQRMLSPLSHGCTLLRRGQPARRYPLSYLPSILMQIRCDFLWNQRFVHETRRQKGPCPSRLIALAMSVQSKEIANFNWLSAKFLVSINRSPQVQVPPRSGFLKPGWRS
jgi:hypothetical protein